jgi:hypothetical protein
VKKHPKMTKKTQLLHRKVEKRAKKGLFFTPHAFLTQKTPKKQLKSG